MTLSRTRRAIAIAGIGAAAALGAAGGAQAADATDRCETRYDRLEAKFRQIEDKRGYDEAVEWWPAAWQKYHERCVI